MMFETPFDASSEFVKQDEEDASVGVKSAEGGILVNSSNGLTDAQPHLLEEQSGIFLRRRFADVYAVDVYQGKVVVFPPFVEEYVPRVVVFRHDTGFVQAGCIADEVGCYQFLFFFGQIHLGNIVHQWIGDQLRDEISRMEDAPFLSFNVSNGTCCVESPLQQLFGIFVCPSGFSLSQAGVDDTVGPCWPFVLFDHYVEISPLRPFYGIAVVAECFFSLVLSFWNGLYEFPVHPVIGMDMDSFVHILFR